MTTERIARPRALITGASAGLGWAFAERLARDGSDLIVVARRRARLEALADQISREAGTQVDVLAADLTDPADLARVEAAAAGSGLDLLVNNAGFGGYLPFVDLPPDRAEELIRLHVLALTRLTRAALPGMIARGRGAIVNVSSALAFSASLPPRPLPYRATYAGCKAYINAFTETLSHEVAGTGVRVQALCPGIVRTEFHEVEGTNLFRDPARTLPMMEPEDVVRASLAGLDLGEVICIPALSDAAVLDTIRTDQRRVLEGTRTAALAPRYQAG